MYLQGKKLKTFLLLQKYSLFYFKPCVCSENLKEINLSNKIDFKREWSIPISPRGRKHLFLN